VLTKDQVEPLRDEAAQFVAAVRTYLNENVGLVLQNQDDDG
jgi:hypothetical protein